MADECEHEYIQEIRAVMEDGETCDIEISLCKLESLLALQSDTYVFNCPYPARACQFKLETEFCDELFEDKVEG